MGIEVSLGLAELMLHYKLTPFNAQSFQQEVDEELVVHRPSAFDYLVDGLFSICEDGVEGKDLVKLRPGLGLVFHAEELPADVVNQCARALPVN